MKKALDVAEEILEPLTIGKLLVGYRQGRGLSQGELAKKLGIAQGRLSEIEKDRRGPTPAMGLRFAKKLGWPPERVLQVLRDNERAALDAELEAGVRELDAGLGSSREELWARLRANR